MEQENKEIERGFKRKMTRSELIKCIIFSLLYVLFILWVGSPLWLLLLPLIIDVYYTKFIPWTWWKKSKNPVVRTVMGWVDAILFALVAVYFINTFFFQNYQIPTSSLEKSLLVGDYLLVSKMSYGSRVPNTPLSFPLAQHTLPILNTKSYLDWPQWGYKRLKGFGNVERYDIVVFNFPAGDTVTTKIANPDYYTSVYYARNGRKTIERQPEIYGDIVYRPVDRRENYVKRTVGLPGDTLQIIENTVFIDGKPLKAPEMAQQNYFIETNGTRFGQRNWEELGVSNDDVEASETNPNQLINVGGTPMQFLEYLGFEKNENGTFNPIYHVPLTAQMLDKVKNMSIVKNVIIEPGFYGGPAYPYGYKDGEWNKSNYGPIWIPKKGETIELNEDTYALYERAIRNYEGNTLEQIGRAHV